LEKSTSKSTFTRLSVACSSPIVRLLPRCAGVHFPDILTAFMHPSS
jgi:hypothetical protein